jgi:hypothetical protein
MYYFGRGECRYLPIRNKEEFDQKLKQHLLSKVSNVVVCNRLQYYTVPAVTTIGKY